MTAAGFWGAQAEPHANQFRCGDHWRGPNGRSYIVRRGMAEGFVRLQLVGRGAPLHLRRESVRGFTRIRWGGQP